ncbi:MAG TPA: hypothetical protein VEM40_06230 [Nitrospirota bacterium]|nr:hypothetical protein [Nitrospirota bacterium]
MKTAAVHLLLLLSLFLAGMNGNGQEPDEREELLQQREELNKKIETLRREQDFLLFEKVLYAADSKYLIINLGSRAGQLKYKNRVLKDFRFKASPKLAGSIGPGALTLTKKREDPGQRHVLVFGKSLVIQWKRPPRAPYQADVPSLSLSKTDLQSIFYALEEGAKAYILTR